VNKAKSVGLLNGAVRDELQAIHQYMYFHFHLDDQGLAPLAELFKRTAITEMGHLERLAERVLFLKGDIEMVPAGAVDKIQQPEAILVKAMAMEQEGIETYNKAALECAQNEDAASKQLFESLIGDEESHFNQFERQRDNIHRFGPNYLALQSFGGRSGGGSEPAA